ncbi:MAG: hypothetical protein ACM3JK_04090 [Betaproteobacteria bacterium]
MSTQPRMWSVVVGIALISLMLACAVPSLAGTASPTPGLAAIGGKEGTGSSNSGTGGGNGGTGGSNGGTGNGNNSSDQSPPGATATPPPLPDVGGPYVVKQIETLGGETISGFVCNLTQPFSVNAATSKVAWVFAFIPQNANHGNVSYHYSIPSAGETHSATGKYTLSPPDKDGTLHVSLTVSDHVTFKKFDGNIPVSYKFDLVPSGNTSCPGQ